MAGPGSPRSLGAKLYEVYWFLPILLLLAGTVGVLMIYSATGGVWQAGALQHGLRLIAGMALMLFIALTDIRVWLNLAYPIYVFALFLLVGVELIGVSVNGSQRWIDLGVTRVQPSEIMKLALVLAMARFYQDLPGWRVSKPVGIFLALAILLLPVVLILRQPDLGTSLLLAMTGITMIFLAGVNWRIISIALFAASIATPLFFIYGFKPYQRERFLTFIYPERDPMGAGYQISQSKIALGSGGVNGKGFREGTQASLNYVPENRTDFIFTVIGEEFGLIGGLGTIALYIMIASVCFWLASQCRNMFSKMLIMGVTTTFILYVFINMGMVMGLAPVVGVPLPLISYGGTVMLTVFAGFGVALSAYIHRSVELPRSSGILL